MIGRKLIGCGLDKRNIFTAGKQAIVITAVSAGYIVHCMGKKGWRMPSAKLVSLYAGTDRDLARWSVKLNNGINRQRQAGAYPVQISHLWLPFASREFGVVSQNLCHLFRLSR